MVQRYCSHDAKEMIASHNQEIHSRKTIGGRPVKIVNSKRDLSTENEKISRTFEQKDKKMQDY